MKTNYTLSSIYHIARADFLERVRSYYFLIAIAVCIFMIYSFVPPLDAGYRIISLDNYRGLYNSAWIGSMVAMCTPFFALVCFYVVNYSVKRDIDTGVGQIIATTRIKSSQYLTGKLISNFLVLLLITILIAVMTVVMFFLRGETRHLELGKLLLPLFIFMVPSMFIIAVLALFFDSFSSLNRGSANIIYFFLWIFLITESLWSNPIDVFGLSTNITELKQSIAAIHPDWTGEFSAGISRSDFKVNHNVFTWEGMKWSSQVILSRIYMMLAALGLLLLVSFVFNRFDTSNTKERKQRKSWFDNRVQNFNSDSISPSQIKYRDLPPSVAKFSFLSLVHAELRLMLKGNSNLWIVISAILFIISIFSSLDFGYTIALPLLWFFQILILSNLGSRELTNRCQEYIFSVAYPLKRQLPATMSAAALIMISLAMPVIIKVLITGNLYSFYAIIIGALFISTLAISIGILTGGSKLFEVLFTIMVYCFLNRIPVFDFIGAFEESRMVGMANYYVAITFALIILAFSARKRQIGHSI